MAFTKIGFISSMS